jgi:lipoate---protein ligase
MFWRLVDTDLALPAYTAACEEAIVLARQKNLVPNTLHLYRRDRPTISLGYFEPVEESVNMEAVRRHGIQLVRRMSGGSAIYTDPDQLIYSAVMNKELLPKEPNMIYEVVCSALIRALEFLGLEAEFKPINDVQIGGKKVSGSAQKMEKEVVIQHGTVIMDADFDLMFEVLKTDNKKVRTKREMTSLSAELGRKVEVGEVKEALIRGFSEVFDATIHKGVLTRFEKKRVEELIRTKYGTEQFTLSR